MTALAPDQVFFCGRSWEVRIKAAPVIRKAIAPSTELTAYSVNRISVAIDFGGSQDPLDKQHSMHAHFQSQHSRSTGFEAILATQRIDSRSC